MLLPTGAVCHLQLPRLHHRPGRRHPCVNASANPFGGFGFNRGNSKAELTDHDGAISDYTKAIDIRNDQPEYYYNRGNAYLDLGKFTDAIDDYDRVTGRSTGHAAFNKGNALLSMGLLGPATDGYLLAEERGLEHDAVNQNLFALSQISLLFEETGSKLQPSPYRDKNRITLQCSVPDGEEARGLETSRFLIYGRAGNSGNTGGPPDLKGSAGAPGKPLTMVEINIQTRTLP